jgi:carbamoyltransferase
LKKEPWVLGLSCSHNGAACLLRGDEIVVAVQDERLLRAKRLETNARFAAHSIAYCLDAAGIRPAQLDLVVCSVTRGDSDTHYQDIFLNETLRTGRFKLPVINIPHHYAHAVSAFATSGFREAAVLIVDGSGTRFKRLPPEEQAVVIDPDPAPRDCEWLSYYEADGTVLTPKLKQMVRGVESDGGPYADFGSLGNMYGFVGAHIFGHPFEGPGKVMGLAPYGRPTIPVEDWLTVADDGLIEFRSETIRRVAARCSWPADFQACADLAASVQRATEYALMRTVERLRALSKSTRLCYAGGVALNSVANELIVRNGGFDDVFVFPAAEDSGVAVGAAYHGLWQLTGRNTCCRLRHDAMGRRYGRDEIERALGATPAIVAPAPRAAPDDVARLLCDGKMLGWFEGRSELGPRSLGQRTILCDPRRPDAKDTLNARVKQREGFRPFAPIVLRELAEEWFDVPPELADSPFMLRVWPFRPGMAERVPAVPIPRDARRVSVALRGGRFRAALSEQPRHLGQLSGARRRLRASAAPHAQLDHDLAFLGPRFRRQPAFRRGGLPRAGRRDVRDAPLRSARPLRRKLPILWQEDLVAVPTRTRPLSVPDRRLPSRVQGEPVRFGPASVPAGRTGGSVHRDARGGGRHVRAERLVAHHQGRHTEHLDGAQDSQSPQPRGLSVGSEALHPSRPDTGHRHAPSRVLARVASARGMRPCLGASGGAAVGASEEAVMNSVSKSSGGVSEVVPFLAVSDMQRSLSYYVDGLGFTLQQQWVDDGKLRWCRLARGGAALMLQEFRGEGHDSWQPQGKLGEGVTLVFICADAVGVYREAVVRGLRASEPEVGNNMWVTSLTDPDGYRIDFESDTDTPEETKLSDLEA